MTDQTAKMFLHGDLGKNYIVSGPGSRLEFHSLGWDTDLLEKLQKIIDQSELMYDGEAGSTMSITPTQYEEAKQLINEQSNRESIRRAERKKEMQVREEAEKNQSVRQPEWMDENGGWWNSEDAKL